MSENKIQETIDWLEYILNDSKSPIIKEICLPNNEEEYNHLHIEFSDGEKRRITIS